MHPLRTLPVLLVLLLPALPGHGALSAWRTQVQASGGSGVGTQFAFDGGPNDPSSHVRLSYLDGVSEASAELSSSGYVPTLRARATNNGTRAQAVAWGVQGYTNTGTVPLDTTLVMSLSATLTGGNDLDAEIFLFQDQNFEFYQDPGTMLFESSSMLWPGFESRTFDLSVRDGTGPVNETRSFALTVQPGESFYVWGRLLATADNRGVADAYSTLTASFTNSSGLSPATVPEPGATLLLLLAAGGPLLLRRRARS